MVIMGNNGTIIETPRPILPVVLVVAMEERRARVGWGPNLHVPLCVTDEVFTHHWGAAFPKMMRSPFPIGSDSVHATRQRVRSRATKADGNVKRRTESTA